MNLNEIIGMVLTLTKTLLLALYRICVSEMFKTLCDGNFYSAMSISVSLTLTHIQGHMRFWKKIMTVLFSHVGSTRLGVCPCYSLLFGGRGWGCNSDVYFFPTKSLIKVYFYQRVWLQHVPTLTPYVEKDYVHGLISSIVLLWKNQKCRFFFFRAFI